MGVRLIDNTEKIRVALKEQIAGGLNEAAQWWTDEAQQNANILTGFMQSHVGTTKAASPNDLTAVIRSLAPYSMYQDTGIHGNLFWTKAYLDTRQRFIQFLYKGQAFTGGAGRGVISAALQSFQHEVTDQGLRVTKVRAYGGGFLTRDIKSGRFSGRYGGRRR